MTPIAQVQFNPNEHPEDYVCQPLSFCNRIANRVTVLSHYYFTSDIGYRKDQNGQIVARPNGGRDFVYQTPVLRDENGDTFFYPSMSFTNPLYFIDVTDGEKRRRIFQDFDDVSYRHFAQIAQNARLKKNQ